jgi:hypothetical protein
MMSDLFSFTRRDFLRSGTMALAGAGLDRPRAEDIGADALDPSTLTAFVDPLPVPRVMKPAGIRMNSERRQTADSLSQDGHARGAAEGASRSADDADVEL